MFILTNFFENFDKFFILEAFVLYYIILSIVFFSIIQSLSKHFFYPLIIKGFIWVSLFTLIVCLIILIDFYQLSYVIVNFKFIFDIYSFFIKFLILFFSLCFFLISLYNVISEQFRLVEYFFIIWICIFSFLSLACSFDFFIMFLIIELQSLSLYLLATFNYNNLYSTEAGLKYFTLSSFSTGFILFGLVLLYGTTGTLNFDELQSFYNLNLSFNDWLFNLSFFACLLILVGFLFKLSAAPFHFWALDVYDGSPSLSMLFFLILPKIVIFLLFFRFFYFVFLNFNFIIFNIILIVGFITVLIGNFGALYELKIKRLITYSGIANVGLLLISFYLFSFEGIQLLFFFLIFYFVTLLLFFSIFFVIRCKLSRVVSFSFAYNLKKSFFQKIKYIEDLLCFFFVHPLVAWLFSLCIFSLAGIPPLMGFFFKFYVVFIVSKEFLFFICLIIISLNFIAYVYYGRFIRTLLFDNLYKNYYWNLFALIPKDSAYFISFFSIFNLLFCLFFMPLFVIIEFFVLNVFI